MKGEDLDLGKEDLPSDFFNAFPAHLGARWILLLDALDEVPEDRRGDLLDNLRNLLAIAADHGDLVVLTARTTLGIDKHFRPAGALYEVQALAHSQQEALIAAWLADRAADFWREVQRVRVTSLLDTPLLLTIAALVYARDGILPNRRADLYNEFVNLWLTEARKHGLDAALGPALADATRPILEHLSLVATERPTASGDRVLRAAVADYLRDDWGLPRGQSIARAEPVLKILGTRSGVFIFHGTVATWAHPTFREYLAACALASLYTPNDHEVYPIVRRWREIAWHPVILFLLACWADVNLDLDPPTICENVSALVEQIQDSGEYGLLFAGEALAEGAPIKPTVAHHIVATLLELAEKRNRPLPLLGFDPIIRLLGRLHGWEEIPTRLRALAQMPNQGITIRVTAAIALADLGDSAAAECLRALAEDATRGDWARVTAAEGLARVGQPQAAAKYLWALAQGAALDSDTRVRAAKVLGDIGHTVEAGVSLSRLTRDVTLDANARMAAAGALADLGQPEEAAACFESLVQEMTLPDNARMRAAKALSRVGRTGEGVAHLRALANDLVLNDQARVAAALALGDLDYKEEAGGLLRRLVQEVTCDAKARIAAAEALGQVGQLGDMAVYLAALAQDRTLDGEERVRAAEALGRFEHAAEAGQLLRTLAQDPSSQPATRLRAVEDLSWIESSKEAAKIYEQLAVVQEFPLPDRVEACMRGGYLYQSIRNWPAAQRSFAMLTRLAPSNPDAWDRFGSVLWQLERPIEATRAYELALTLDPALPHTQNNLANLLLEQGDLPGATKHFEARIRLEPSTALEAEVGLGVLAWAQDEIAAARRHFQVALKIAFYTEMQGTLSLAYLDEDRALALLALGRIGQAEDALREAFTRAQPGELGEPDARWLLLQQAPHPPDGLDRLLALWPVA